MQKTISSVVPSQKVNMGGIILDQPLPSRGHDMVDPFLLIHHWDDTLPGGQLQSQAGVGPHPHRGFTPVTFIYQGGVHHRDSTGVESIIQAGGTQWMNSGRGIVHSERPTKELANHGGKFEIIQFWVNTPADSKFNEPSYQPLTKSDTPIVNSEDGLFKIGVVSGEVLRVKGVLHGHSALTILRLDSQKEGKIKFQIPATYNCLIYLLNGSLIVNGTEVNEKQMVIFENDGDEMELYAQSDTRAILLSGQPLNEPVVSYGPFVMNTDKEVMDAIKDYQSGKLGTLIENFDS